MALRFRKRIRLMPGVYLNLGMTGVSLTGGIRGASLAAGRRGIYSNLGLPGTGLSFRSKLNSSSSAAHPVFVEKRQSSADVENRRPTSLSVTLRLQDDGQVIIEGEDGQPLGQRQLKLMRDQKGDFVRSWLEEAVAKLNSDYEASVSLHFETPSPANPRWLLLPSYDDPPPTAPQPPNIRLADRLLLRRRRIESNNAKRLEEYQRELDNWTARANEHLQLIDGWRSLGQAVVNGDSAAMEATLGNILSTLPWPRETEVSFELGDDCTTLNLDVDLPEIEDMPNRIATVAAKGIRVTFQKRTEAQIRRDYIRLVHGTAFRVVGEVFANLPTVSKVTVSEFTQRPNPQTGEETEDYVLSVRIRRDEWETINFGMLQNVDPIDALARFELVRSPDRAGRLRGIAPLR